MRFHQIRSKGTKIFKSIFVFFLLFNFLFSIAINSVRAAVVTTPISDAISSIDLQYNISADVTEKVEQKIWQVVLDAMGGMVFNTVRNFALDYARDQATYLASGREGEKPQFKSEYFDDMGLRIAEAAGSAFINQLGEKWGVDALSFVCRPSLDVRMTIGLGLANVQNRTIEPDCTFSEMASNWENEWDKWNDISKDWEGFVLSSVNPSSSEIGMTMLLWDQMDEDKNRERSKIQGEAEIAEGWLGRVGYDDLFDSLPGEGRTILDQQHQLSTELLLYQTGNILIDVANVFANTYFSERIQRALRQAGENSGSLAENSPGSFGDGDQSGGTSVDRPNIVTQLADILRPQFSERRDYTVLASFSSCSANAYMGPNTCVVSSSFVKAVEDEVTLSDAISKGLINPNLSFTPVSDDFRNTLTARSLSILRKFRIVPVTWEEVIRRIEQNANNQQNAVITINDLMSCYDSEDEFDTFNPNFTSNQTWCEGLVDPYWVLKAPLNYCAKEGYGGHVLSTNVINTPDIETEIEGGENIIIPGESQILVTRSETYCADERTCIREKSDGSCVFYGYCTEEKRNWDFDADSCDPNFNTCQTFSSESGTKLSLLQNSLTYYPCDSDNAGCSIYSKFGAYDVDTKKVAWSNDPEDLIYFNNQASSCDLSSEGCNEFIRASDGFGHNYIIDGSFQNVADWQSDGYVIDEGQGHADSNAASFTTTFSVNNIEIGPDTSEYSLAGETFNLSFYLSCDATSTVFFNGQEYEKQISPSANHTWNSLVKVLEDDFTGNTLSFNITNSGASTCYISKMKLEKGSRGTVFSDYRQNALIYKKTIPNYLESTCYDGTTYNLRDDAPSECLDYSRFCEFDELGCAVYGLSDGRTITAKALTKDSCPSECNTYDTYIQSASTFESPYPFRLIPDTAQKCSLANIGCTEFTNLDDLPTGGEKLEYYTYLRQCIKPQDGDCANFYSWEGNDESGFQLRSFILNSSSDQSQMLLTEGSFVETFDGTSGRSIFSHVGPGNVDWCNADVYDSPVGSPAYNADCREFYNQAGDTLYVLYTKTKTCSNTCNQFRMTEKNIDHSITEAGQCVGPSYHWGIVQSELYEGDLDNDYACIYCKDGGVWDNNQQACLYKAIPGEGKPCPASANMCREYVGNKGSSIRPIYSNDFEADDSAWDNASVALVALENQGKSMLINSGSTANLENNSFREGSSYVLSFLANGNGDMQAYVSKSGSSERNYFEVIQVDDGSTEDVIDLDSGWNFYRINLESLDIKLFNDEKYFLNIESIGANLYVDDIILSEVSDRYYLIRGSWNTPISCYFDVAGVQRGPNYNLGCASYINLAGRTFYLRQFAGLCDSKSAGCEMMINTNNYSQREAASFDLGNSQTVEVAADYFQPVVFKQDMLCNSDAKGCSLLGKVSSNVYDINQNYGYEDVYLNNNPDTYDTSLCLNNEVGCSAWNSDNGVSYFKDPLDNVCEFRNNNWYAKKVKRCETTLQAEDQDLSTAPNLCSSDADCGGLSCVLDQNNYLCPTNSDLVTVGNSGVFIQHPSTYAALCPMEQSSCTEYIDPNSSFNPNIVNNPRFEDINQDGQFFDNWTPVNSGGSNLVGKECEISGGNISCSGSSDNNAPHYFTQTMGSMSANTLYSINLDSGLSARLDCFESIYTLNDDNVFEESNVIDIDTTTVFYSASNSDSCIFTIELGDSTDNTELSFYEAIVDYKKVGDIDLSSCTAYNFNQGCIALNQRQITGQYFDEDEGVLKYNYSNFASLPVVYSNIIAKVRPGRDCGKWLSCVSYMEDDEGNRSCLTLGLCTSMGIDGECNNFVSSGSEVLEITAENVSLYSNLTGYSILGNYNLDRMTQEGSSFPNFNYDFESHESIDNWYFLNEEISRSDFDHENNARFCTVLSANQTIVPSLRQEAVYPPPSGVGMLRVGNLGVEGPSTTCNGRIHSTPVNVKGGDDYYISFYYNADNYARFGSDFQMIARVVTYDEDTEGISWDWHNNISVDLSKKGWQKYTHKFKPDDNVSSVVVIFQPGNHQDPQDDPANYLIYPANGPIYVDDVSISPVLEVSPTDSLASSCRLYPAQDSLVCDPAETGLSFVEMGWRGYCLQKDPANKDVCLMWYPVDTIAGSAFEAASTGWYGYPETGTRPSYCLEFEANFDLVEYRDVYYLSHRFKTDSEDSNWSGAVGTPPVSCDSAYTLTRVGKFDTSNNNCNNAFTGSGGFLWGPEAYAALAYCSPVDGSRLISFDENALNKMNIPEISWNLDITKLQNDYILKNNIKSSETLPALYCTDSSPSDADGGHCSFWGDYKDDDDSSNCDRLHRDAEWINTSNAWLGWSTVMPSNAGLYIFDGGVANFNNIGANSSNQSWKKLPTGSDYKTPEQVLSELIGGPLLMAYDISESECYGGSYDHEDFDPVFFERGAGVGQCPLSRCLEDGKGACLMHPESYSPKCVKSVKMLSDSKPWSSRLKSSPNSLGGYFTNNGGVLPFATYLNDYKLHSVKSPFGAASSNPDGAIISSDIMGLPFSCFDGDRTNFNSLGSVSRLCNFLYYDNNDKKIKFDITASNDNRFFTERPENLDQGQEFLKHIFAGTPGNNYNAIPWCQGDVNGCDPRPNDTVYCKRKPHITNISLRSGLDTITPDPADDYAYKVTSSGFYTINFNTSVDAEQSPIANLKLVVRRKTQSWTSGEPEIVNTVSEIDHKPNPADPHNFVSYLGPGEYYIAVRVEDNWGEFSCSGLQGFNPIPSVLGLPSGITACRNCCNNNLDGSDCGGCATDSLYNGVGGDLYACPN